jgi:hypothetical protein
MKRSVLFAVFPLLLSISVNASWLEGNWYWSTKFGRDILIFGTNNNLVFQSDYKMDDEKKTYRLFGTWKFQLGVCRSGDKQEVDEGTTVEGNLMLSINSTQCCLNAALQGNKLVLTKVWVKGSGLALHAYCSDNLLIPFESPSD